MWPGLVLGPGAFPLTLAATATHSTCSLPHPTALEQQGTTETLHLGLRAGLCPLTPGTGPHMGTVELGAEITARLGGWCHRART